MAQSTLILITRERERGEGEGEQVQPLPPNFNYQGLYTKRTPSKNYKHEEFRFPIYTLTAQTVAFIGLPGTHGCGLQNSMNIITLFV